MGITFNDTWHNIKGAAYFDASAAAYTVRGNTGNVYNVDIFPGSGVDIGDAFLFAVDWNTSGKANEIKVNLDVGVAAATWDGVWEYCVGGTNAVPGWTALSGVTDGTSKLQNTGSNTVLFTVPDDWDNFHLTNVSGTVYYCFLIRFRITSVSGLTEGGHIANVSNNCQAKGYTIYVSGYTSGAPATFTDIYNASVAGGWGVVTKNKNQFFFNCNLSCAAYNYLISKQEQICFNTNWFIINDGYSVFNIGEVYSGNKVRYGSNIVFIGRNCNYPSWTYIFGQISLICNAQIRHYWEPSPAGYNGYWSGGFGGFPGQAIYDCYIEGFRQTSFPGNNVAVIGVKQSGGQIEGSGAIIAEGAVFNTSCGQRLQHTVNTYIHAYDFSKVITAPFNPYLYNNDNNNFYAVDCDCGTFTYDKYAQWTSGSGTNNKVWMLASVLLKVVDKQGNVIAGATVTLKDKNGDTVFSYITNADGYPGQDSGSLTGATASSISDTAKGWAAQQWRWREIYMTSGPGIKQRRYIKYQSAGPYTTLPLAPDFQTTPSINDRYIIIPYVPWLKLTPLVEETLSVVWSNYLDYNPFTLTVTKTGYKTVTLVQEIKSKQDRMIIMTPIDHPPAPWGQ